MNQHDTLLTLPNEPQPLSIRAKALVFSDVRSRTLLKDIERIAPSEAPVLITGETGTGKELVARHVHACSNRRGPFMAVNCGALTESLAEAELFGHEAGAYTGATGARVGWFEAANGGTLFLDEVGDLPLSLQVKLLRVLQEREVVRIGSRKPIKLDVRLVTATNIDLAQAMSSGHFRPDLYYRVSVVNLSVPPLRERIGDILPLAEYFLGTYSQRLNTPLPRLLPETVAALIAYSWPGNIRELENVIHFALLVCNNNQIHPENLRFAAQQANGAKTVGAPFARIEAGLRELYAVGSPGIWETLERHAVKLAFEVSGHNQVRAAELMGVSRNTVRTLLKNAGLIS